MESYKSELQVGMPAMIVGVHHPENSHFLGKVVMVEALMFIGESIQAFYKPDYAVLPLKMDMAVIVGIGTGKHHLEGYSTIQQKHLMPLPPLEEPSIDECTFTPIVQKEKA